jgi:formylglycine-generating enzyme required for sulfatase activity
LTARRPARRSAVSLIDGGWHPLAAGVPPVWASAWGQDDHGVFACFEVAAVTQKMRWIPPGRFHMGSPENEPGRWPGEGPRRWITIAEGFWLAETPCTQALWQAVTGGNPSRFRTPERPVENVSFEDVEGFLARINGLEPDLNLCLPSEAWWEYACRAGTGTATYAGPIEILGQNNAPVLDDIAWYAGNSGRGFELDNGHDTTGWREKQYGDVMAGTHPVARKKPNPWGLYDMLGNVWEWCADAWHDSHNGARADGTPRPLPRGYGAAARVIRGGSWYGAARRVRAAYRSGGDPAGRFDDLGFRCARVQNSG